ncbi:MAG: hypothetical protein HDQ88_03915 [Clostridia bacterium]|nr:hypothetical protein [Clostridia bacterium]
MRYFSVEDISFTNALGRTVMIKDILPVQERSQNSVSIAISKDDELDEIATRTDIYGEGYESQSYEIFAENIEELTQVDFDMNRLKSLRIPE